MGGKLLHSLMAIVLVLTFGSAVSAAGTDNFNDQMIEKTKEAFDVQISLSERGYSYSEVHELLTPYFMDQFIDSFITINMMKEDDNLYYIMGTDFPIYYIPFFKYEGETIVITNDDLSQVIVYEFFPAVTDGPVGYDDHYEAVVYRLDNEEWKIDEIIPQYNPDEAIVDSKAEVKTVTASEQSANLSELNEQEESASEESKNIVEKGLDVLRAITSFFSSLFGS